MPRYLLDKLERYEKDYSNALHPDFFKTNRSHLREHFESQPVTRGVMRAEMSALEQRMEGIEKCFEAFEDTLKERLDTGFSLMLDIIAASRSSHLAPAPKLSRPAVGQPQQPPAPRSSALTVADPVATPPGASTSTHRPQAPEIQVTEPAAIQAEDDAPECIPSIPNLQTPKGGGALWRCAVLDWEHADTDRKLFVALKDWPKKWYVGKPYGPKFAPKRHQRRLIAEEYIIRCHRDDAVFYAKYPEADTLIITDLVKAIRVNNPEDFKKRASKNGTAAERERKRRRLDQ